MIAPQKPEGLVAAVGTPMHQFLSQQLEMILEGETTECRDVAGTLFARGMERLYKRGVEIQYTKYYEQLYEVANHGRTFMDSPEGKRLRHYAEHGY